jgi:two-component system sensor histidine kinase BaeS
MPRLTLQSKAFFALSALLVVLLLLFAGFSRLGLQRGLGPYVAEIELARMDWLASRLQNLHAQHGGWQTLHSQPPLWRDLRRPELPARPQFGPGVQTPPELPFRKPLLQGDTPDGLDRQAHDGPLTTQAAPTTAPPANIASAPANLLSPDSGTGQPLDRPPGRPDGLAQRLGLLDNERQLIAGIAPQPGYARTQLRDADGKPIGQLVLSPPDGLEREADVAFLAQQLVFMVWTGVAGLILALLLSWWLSRRWLAPIGALVAAARGIAAGRLDTRVPEQGDDELARLVHTFNDMAEQLASAEASRRQWIGDVAHELRTPLAAMRAEIEAVQDGVRRFDDSTALRLHRQVMRLTQLVTDLRASLDATGGDAPIAQEPLQPLHLLSEAMASMQPRFAQAGVVLDGSGLQPRPNLPDHDELWVRGDTEQLHRVFLNLLENSLRYTYTGGRLQVSAQLGRHNGLPLPTLAAHLPGQPPPPSSTSAQLVLRFDDSAPGVAPQELPRIFERLYRAQTSRSRAQGDLGGSGLGLAICRTIVQAHGGQISAEASPLGGLRITLTLPLLEKHP